MNSTKRITWIVITAALCVGIDQWTKALAKQYLNFTDVHSLLGDTVRLQLSHNRGAFLGLGDSLPEVWRQRVFVIGVGALLIGVLAYALLAKMLDRLSIVALALIFAGGVSNLADRIVYGGYVVDFLNFKIGPLHTGILNVADMAITTGTLLLLLDAFRHRR